MTSHIPDAGQAYRPVAYRPERMPAEESRRLSDWLRHRMAQRRTVRAFSADPVEERLAALRPLGTDEDKPQSGRKHKHYYADESVGIAVGMLLTALHLAGLAALTHTPSPMRFLSEILGRPRNEKAFAVIPAGYPAGDALVPDLVRKPLDQVLVRV